MQHYDVSFTPMSHNIYMGQSITNCCIRTLVEMLGQDFIIVFIIVAGFQLNSEVLQLIVSRYANSEYSMDFDCFMGCLIRLEMLFSEWFLTS